jgi:hypothetical protein
VSTRNRRLLVLSVTKRRPLFGVQTCSAADFRCVKFPVGGRRRDACRGSISAVLPAESGCNVFS